MRGFGGVGVFGVGKRQQAEETRMIARGAELGDAGRERATWVVCNFSDAEPSFDGN